jgi:hypothetical protein
MQHAGVVGREKARVHTDHGLVKEEERVSVNSSKTCTIQECAHGEIYGVAKGSRLL